MIFLPAIKVELFKIISKREFVPVVNFNIFKEKVNE